MAFSRTSLMGKLECFRKPSAHSQAKFLGAGVWEIEGSHYFGDVTIVGPKPDMDMSYPCSFRCPDTRRGVLIIVPERKVNRPGTPSPPDVAGWTHWAQGAGRTSRSAWTSLDIRRLGIVSYLYGGSTTRNLVRVMGQDIYADIYGGYLVKMVYGSMENIVADWGGAQPLDLVLHETSGSVFLLLGSSVTRLSLSNLSEVWSRNFAGVTTASYSLFVAGDAVGCLATAANATSGGRTLRMATWDIETGTPITAPTELSQQPIPAFPGDPLDVPYVSGAAGGGTIQSWDKICQWLPGGEVPEYAEGEGSQVGRKFHPFGWVDDMSRTNWTAPPVYPADPQTLAVKDTLRWGFSGGAGDFSMPIPSGVNPVICVGDTIVPHVRFTPSLVGYTPSGSTAFEVTGWGFPPPAERSHLRKFFTPVMADGNRMLVVARHCTYYDIQCTAPVYKQTVTEVKDLDYVPIYPTMYWVGTSELVETGKYRARVLLSQEDFLEVYDAAGNLVASTPCTTEKIFSMAHFPEGDPGPAHGGPYIFDVAAEYEDQYEEGDYPDQGFTEDENFYSQPWIGTTRVFNLINDDPPEYKSVVDPAEAGGDFSGTRILKDGSRILCVGLGWTGSIRLGAPTAQPWIECTTKTTQIDTPLLYDWTKPVLNTNKSLLIFPPMVWSDGTFDANHDMVLRDVRRSWDAPFEDSFLEDVVLGPDWRKRERQWIYAFNWPAMTLAWRHEISFTLGSTVAVGIPGCGGGKCYVPYRLNSQTRIRVLDDTTGELIEDFVPSGAQVGQVNANSQIILTGDVALLVTDSGVMGIYEEA